MTKRRALRKGRAGSISGYGKNGPRFFRIQIMRGGKSLGFANLDAIAKMYALSGLEETTLREGQMVKLFVTDADVHLIPRPM
jgi:hypothetical protein